MKRSKLGLEMTASLKVTSQEQTISKLNLKRKQWGFLQVVQHKCTEDTKWFKHKLKYWKLK